MSDESMSSIRLPAGEILRPFDLFSEDVGRLVALKEAVYGLPVDREVFAWEYFGHPLAKQIRVFVCEKDGAIVASTTRLPAPMILRGVEHPAYFNIESMVHPEHRRKGRMRDLYAFARKRLPGDPVLVSKGSSEQIFPLLVSIGHRVLRPDTFLVSRPSVTRWLLSRLHLRSAPRDPAPIAPPGFEDFEHVPRFGGEMDRYFERVCRKFTATFKRDATMMNWRYVDIPHKRYTAFRRVVGGMTTSVVVLSLRGEKGFIMDILWDPDRRDEPERSVRFSQRWLSDSGSANVVCFATSGTLRETLTQAGFFDCGETPRFSAVVPTQHDAVFSSASSLHVVDGDGDTEFS